MLAAVTTNLLQGSFNYRIITYRSSICNPRSLFAMTDSNLLRIYCKLFYLRPFPVHVHIIFAKPTTPIKYKRKLSRIINAKHVLIFTIIPYSVYCKKKSGILNVCKFPNFVLSICLGKFCNKFAIIWCMINRINIKYK